MLGNTTATMTNNRTQVKSCGLQWKEERLRTRLKTSRVLGQVLESFFSPGSVFGSVRFFEWPNCSYDDWDKSIFRVGTQCPERSLVIMQAPDFDPRSLSTRSGHKMKLFILTK